ncbi:signal peptidase I [Candidatus Woesearchaeota archaeon]|nr:signal peptidase I [Candidatus Woesearchaeota archaeon]
MATGGTLKRAARRFWNFVWNDNSIWSWIFNAALAFIIIKFLVYPGLGLVLHTQSPVVAVISDSMRHNDEFDKWWESMEKTYTSFNISKDEFKSFTMSNGFKRGDLILLKGKKPDDIQVGDVLVFKGTTPEPVIHRVVKKWNDGGKYYLSTKGDANAGQRDEEREISENRIVGTGWVKVPYLGYVKIIFTDMINTIRG